MNTFRVGMLILLGGTLACSEGQRRGGNIPIDTLYGFKLGGLFPDILSSAATRGVSLACPEEEHDGVVLCERPTLSVLDRGPYMLGFKEGRLIYISYDLKGEWRGVPVDSLRRRLAEFGAPAVDTTAEDGSQWVSWVDEEARVVRTLFCFEASSAADCTISTELLTEAANGSD